MGLGRGHSPLPRKKMILGLNMVSLGGILVVFFTVQLTVLHVEVNLERYNFNLVPFPIIFILFFASNRTWFK